MMNGLLEVGINDYYLITSALLHDVLEDADMSYEDFKFMFGCAVFDMVYSLSNLDEYKNKMKKADYFTRFASDIQNDWRIMLIKLFDCLDNLETIEHLSYR